MNSVSLVGNLATEVELRQVGEKKVASFLLAVGRSGRDTGADFVWISAWERQAELCAEYLSKGNRIAVEGRLKIADVGAGRPPPRRDRDRRAPHRLPRRPEERGQPRGGDAVRAGGRLTGEGAEPALGRGRRRQPDDAGHPGVDGPRAHAHALAVERPEVPEDDRVPREHVAERLAVA